MNIRLIQYSFNVPAQISNDPWYEVRVRLLEGCQKLENSPTVVNLFTMSAESTTYRSPTTDRTNWPQSWLVLLSWDNQLANCCKTWGIIWKWVCPTPTPTPTPTLPVTLPHQEEWGCHLNSICIWKRWAQWTGCPDLAEIVSHPGKYLLCCLLQTLQKKCVINHYWNAWR